MTKSRLKKLLFQIFQIIISLGLLIFIIYKADPAALLETLKQVELRNYFYFTGIAFIATVLMVWRWYLLLKATLNKGGYFFKTVEYTFIGFFFNLIMPTSIGGDLVRAYLIGKNTGEMEKSSMTVLVDRFMGVASIFAIGLVSILLAFNELQDKRLFYIILSFFILIIISAMIFLNRKIMGFFSRIFDIFKLTGLKKRIKEFYEGIYVFKQHKLSIINVFILSIIMQLINVYSIFVLSKGMNIQVSFYYFLIFIPLIYVLQMLPISISGIGVRENSFVFFLGLVGVEKDSALLLSLLYFSFCIITGIIGAVVTMFSKFNYKQIEENNE